MNRNKIVRVSLIALALVCVSLGGTYGWMRYQRTRDLLPEFVDPPAGARGPSIERFGFTVGRASYTSATELLERAHVECQDTSMRAIMRHSRSARAQAAVASGESPDVIASASWNRPSPRERNPQVRLSCADVEMHALDASYPEGVRGRLLLVFDSESLPLRHVSLRRLHTSEESARIDAELAMTHYRSQIGAPPERIDGTTEGWQWADRSVKIEEQRLGRLVTVNEAVEIPWPVRADTT
jgi:hypothetical protein